MAVTVTVEAIYQGGVIKPLAPLDLRENERIRLQIEREPLITERRGKDIVSLRGIWKDRPLPDEDEVETAIREIRAMTERRLERLARELEEAEADRG